MAKKARTAKNPVVLCTACGKPIAAEELENVETGDQIGCEECGELLEVMGVDPVELRVVEDGDGDEGEDEEEDGEDCDEDGDLDDDDYEDDEDGDGD